MGLSGGKYYPDPKGPKPVISLVGLSASERLEANQLRKSRMSDAEKIIEKAAQYDPFGSAAGADGFVPRAIKGHCFMLLIFILLLIVGYVVVNTWKPLWNLVIRRVIAIISFGQWAEFTVDHEEERDEFVSPYTGEYRRELDKQGTLLSAQDKKAGYTQHPIDHGNRRERFREWMDDGVSTVLPMWPKVPHQKGDKMRSWEGIEKIPSYNILKNPEYRKILEFGARKRPKNRRNSAPVEQSRWKTKMRAVGKLANSAVAKQMRKVNDKRQDSILLGGGGLGIRNL